MKKTRILCMACLALGIAFSATSCKKNETNGSLATIKHPTLEFDDDTRVYIDFGNSNILRWNANDKIMVYNLDFADGTNSVCSEFETGEEAEGELYAQFHGQAVGSVKDGYFFFYPASMSTVGRTTGILDAQNRETFTIGETQYYRQVKNHEGHKITTMAAESFAEATTTDDMMNFNLEPIMGAARLYLTGPTDLVVDHIEIIDNVFNLTGNATFKLHEVNSATLSNLMDLYFNHDDAAYEPQMASYLATLGYSAENTGKMVTLDCSGYEYEGETFAGVQLPGNLTYLESFVFSLRPGALSKGFVVNIYFADHRMLTLTDWANLGDTDDRSYCIRPGRIKAIRPLPLTPVNYPTGWGTW